MICALCGYIQADTERVCRRCGHIVPVRKPTALARMESNLPPTNTEVTGAGGPFPREVQSAATVPAWRAELSARVRQVKARRMMESELEAARRDQLGSASRQVETETPPPHGIEAPPEPPPTEAGQPDSTPPLDDLEAVENPLVRGALRRVRRAAESPRPPLSFPPRRMSAATPDLLTLDAPTATATSSAAPPVDISEIASELDAALGDFDLLADQPATEAPSETRPAPTPPPPSPPTPTRLLRRIRPLVRERVLAGVIDAAVVALSCLPLLCVVIMTGTVLIHPSVAAIVACAAVLIAGMYAFGTVTVAGQTFGMMYMGLRVVSIYEDHELHPVQALLRALGYGLSLLPLGAGFLWVLIDRDQRGWHEYLSATQLVREWYVETLPDQD
ncbi:RDD family protein [Chloracidobacterium validum]|uniref:RDD family protein n=1 Tax=Chloracidobacterium validum TaxID=2821543 RepID=A0ABX8B758_9BACT|nr:RDD family protein [Chloracidobacterium validum]QUW02748.1 RDD family protein [Chloracidobacterium validum]